MYVWLYVCGMWELDRYMCCVGWGEREYGSYHVYSLISQCAITIHMAVHKTAHHFVYDCYGNHDNVTAVFMHGVYGNYANFNDFL